MTQSTEPFSEEDRRREERRDRFKRNLAEALADPQNVPPSDMVYPVTARFMSGPKAMIFDARGKPCLPDFIYDEETAATLVNWVNQIDRMQARIDGLARMGDRAFKWLEEVTWKGRLMEAGDIMETDNG